VPDKLEAYRKKRDFTKTTEPPPGDPDAEARNLVFVVQQHAASRMHWDFRLEVDGVLKSWPLPKGPSLNPKDKRMAVQTEDHPYDYRTFEGVIPKGEYGGGQVIVWDEGIYTPDEDGQYSWDNKEEGSRRMLEGIERGKLSFTLQGKKLHGSFTLIKTKYEKNSWLFIKHKDEFVSERDVLQEDYSVRSGLTIADLKEGRLPSPDGTAGPPHPHAAPAPIFDSRKVRPMLSTLIDEAFDRPGWIWEPKLDGIRILAFVQDGNVELRSRRGIDVTKQYPTLVAGLKAQPARSMVIDGEVCALDEEGVPRFQLIQPRINLTRGADLRKIEEEIPVVYYAFDMLYLDGYDLRLVPLSARKELMEKHFRPQGNLLAVPYVEEHGRDMAEGAANLGFEGVVGKRQESRYDFGGRSKSWVKVKTVKEQEFVVGGYTPGEGGRKSTFGALSLGYYDDGELRFIGNVGSGFTDKTLQSTLEKLKEREIDKSPFNGPVEGKPQWVQPTLVAQVKYQDWTKDDHLRAPVFLGLRDDIDPRQVRREVAADVSVIEDEAEEEVAGEATSGVGAEVASVLDQLGQTRANLVLEIEGVQVKVTNLDKAFWPAHGDEPEMTKRDLIRYYTEVAPVLLPHLKDRPLTLTRYPNGVAGDLFYQKHYAQPIPDFVDTVKIWSTSNNVEGEYILCNNLATLVWLAQIADLELHAWMARVDPEPDSTSKLLTFDGSEERLDESVLNYPDYMVFDLDPYIYSGKEGKGAEPEYNRRGWEKTVEVAHALKDLLDGLQLSSYLKTSGKTGLHIYTPILRHFDYDQVRAATQTIGRFLMQQMPNDITMEWDTTKRQGKVFFDAGQNTRGKTLAAQYSLRPTAWAGVSTPILWSELPKLDPVVYNLRTVPARIREKGDLWADILHRKNDLGSLLGG
jgi:bifunctional non-homologous end joining protein LigD